MLEWTSGFVARTDESWLPIVSIQPLPPDTDLSKVVTDLITSFYPPDTDPSNFVSPLDENTIAVGRGIGHIQVAPGLEAAVGVINLLGRW